MGQPLRDMDKQQLLLEQINRVNALAVANDITPLNLGPLARMSLSAAMKQVHDKNNEVIVALDGTVIPWGGPLKDPAAAAQALDQSMDYTDTLGGDEESDRPEWVPPDGVTNLTHFIEFGDFGSGPAARAWVRGVGEVEVATLLGADANTENYWGESGYDPAQLSADGYATVSGAYDKPVAYIGTALTKVLAGATVRVQTKDSDYNYYPFSVISADGNSVLEVNGRSSRKYMGYSAASYFVETEPLINIIPASVAMNVFAGTFTPTRAEFTANGGDAVEDTVTPDDWPTSGGSPIVASYIYVESDGFLQSVALYDPLPSTTGLSALSETGVTNTAPTNLVVVDGTWQGGGASSNETETTADFAAAYFEGASPESPAQIADTFSADDAEGNPLTLSLVDDDGGNFDLDPETPLPQIGVRAVVELGDGPPSFTVRATDPGGPYVEQEFTITVTA